MDEESQATLDMVRALMGAMGSDDMETMGQLMTESGKETGDFTFALRVKVRDGQVVLWKWFEDSYAISTASSGGEA